MNRKELFAWGKQCPVPFVQALIISIGEVEESLRAIIVVFEVTATKMREHHVLGTFGGYQGHLHEATRSHERLHAKLDMLFAQLEGLHQALGKE